MNEDNTAGELLAIRVAVALLLARAENIDLDKFAEIGIGLMKTVLQGQRPMSDQEAQALQNMALGARKFLDQAAMLAATIRTHVPPDSDPT